jgi:hypothetical protein
MNAIKKRTFWDSCKAAAWKTGKAVKTASDKIDALEVKCFGRQVDDILDDAADKAINRLKGGKTEQDSEKSDTQ